VALRPFALAAATVAAAALESLSLSCSVSWVFTLRAHLVRLSKTVLLTPGWEVA